MKISKSMGGLLKLSVVMVAALLCVSLAVTSLAGSTVASAESLTISQGSTALMERNGKIMKVEFTSAADWKNGYEVKYNSNLSGLTTIFDGTQKGSSVTNYGNDGSMHFVHKNKAGSTRTMVITYLQLDSYLQQIAALGALRVQAKMTSANSDVGSITLKAYFESDTPTAAAIDSTDDDTQGNLGTIRDNEDYVFAATSKAGANLSSTGSFATFTVPSTSKYMLLVIQTKRSYAANMKDGPADYSDISVKFSIDTSKLGGNISYMGQTIAGNTFGNISSIFVSAKGNNTPYGLTTTDSNQSVASGIYAVSGGVANIADMSFAGQTSKGVEVKGAINCPTGMGAVVSGGKVTEDITFSFNGGAAKTLAQAISDGYISSNSANTWGANATTVNFSWTFIKNATITISFKNLKGDTLRWKLILTGIDKTAPNAPTFIGNSSDWYVSDETIDLFDVSSSLENGITYLYQYAYSASSFDTIDESKLTLKRSSNTTTEVKGDKMIGTTLPFSFPKGSGYYKVKAVAIDGAGNCSAETAIYNLKLDKDAPVASIRVTTDDGKVYFDGDWVNKNVSVSFLRLKATISGTTFFYSTDGGTTWDNANTMTEGDVLNVSVPDGVAQSFIYKFKAVKGTGEEIEIGEPLYNINIDKSAPVTPVINHFDDYLVSSGYNWFTSAWNMTVRFDYADAGLGLGGGVILYCNVTEGGVNIFEGEYNLQAIDNRIDIDFSGSTLGGARTIVFYVVDQAGNRSSDLVIEFLADANVYTIDANALENAITGNTGGRIVLDKSDKKYKRNDVVNAQIVAETGYRFFAEDFDYTYSGAPLTLDGENRFSFDLYKNNVTADPAEIALNASFRLVISPVAASNQLVYNGELQAPALKDVAGKISEDIFDFALNVIADTQNRNVGSYSFVLNYKNNQQVFFEDVEISYDITPATLTVAPAIGQKKVYGDADLAFNFDVSGILASDTLADSSVLAREAGENVGSYAYVLSGISVSDGNGGNNYTVEIADDTEKFVIEKRAVTVRPAGSAFDYSGEVIYCAAELADGSMAFAESVSDLNVKFLIGKNAGEYVALPVLKTGDSTDVANAPENANYQIFFDISAKLVINPLVVDFVAGSVEVLYGAEEAVPAFAPSVALVTENDFIVVSFEREAGLNVGTYGILSAEIQMTNSNFILGNVDLASGSYVINPAAVTATVENEAIYGDDFTANIAYTGLVNGETVPQEYLTFHFGVLTALGNVNVISTEFVAAVTAALPNYQITFASDGSVEVLPRPIVANIGRIVSVEELATNPVTAEPASIELTFQNALEGADFSAVTLTYFNEEGLAVTPDAEGFFQVQINGLPAEYVLSSDNLILIIGTGKIVLIGANQLSKVYDGLTVDVASLFEYSVDGTPFTVQEGEVTFGITSGQTEIKNADVYTVSVSVKRAATETEPAYFGNAQVQYVVEKANVVIEIATANRVYGDEIPTSVDFVATGVVDGQVIAPDFAGFDGVAAGNYAITLNGFVVSDAEGADVSQNYNVELANAEYTVEKAQLIVRPIGGTAEYGILKPVISYIIEGFKNGEDETAITAPEFSLKSELSILIPGVYTEVVAQGFAAANYDMTLNMSSFEYIVRQKVVSISEIHAFAANKTYDGTTLASGGIDISEFVVGGDDVSVTATARFDSAMSGVRKVIFENIKLVGANAGYYELVSETAIVLNNIVISKFVWVINETAFNVQIAGKVYDGTDIIPESSITGADACIPELFKASGVQTSVLGVYDNKNAGTDKTAVLTVSVALENWAENIEFVEDGSVERLVSDKNKVVFRFTKTGLEIQKRNLVIKSVKANDSVFSGRADLDYRKFSYTFEEGKGIAAGDIVFLDVSGSLDDVNVGTRTANFVVRGLRSAGNYQNYVLDETENAAFIGVDLSNQVAITPIEVVLGVKLEDGRSYTGADEAGINIESASLAWGIDGNTGIDLAFAFVWDRSAVATFADGTGNVLLDNRGNAVAKRVIVSGIELSQSDAVKADAILAADPKYNVANYVISGVNDGMYYTEALISPKHISIDEKLIILNEKFYDKTADGSISFAPNAIEGIVESDKGLVTPKSVVMWSTTEAGESYATVNILGLVGERAANYVLSESLTGIQMLGVIKPAVISIDEIVFEDKNYDATTKATFQRASIGGVYEGDRVELEVYDYAFVSPNVDYVSDGVYNPVKIIAYARLKEGSNRNYSLYDGSNAVDSIRVEESAVINPYVLSFGQKNIAIDAIVYELAFLDRDPSAPMDIDKANYRISYETLPNNEKIDIRFASARYMSVAVSSNINCEFVVEGIYSDNRINRNYVLNGSETITCGARIRPAHVEISVAGTDYKVEYGDVFDISKVGIDYIVNGVRLESTSAAYKKIADIAKTIVVSAQNAKTPAGSASITLNYSSNSSFEFTTKPGTVTITPAVLHVSTSSVNVIAGNEIIMGELTYYGWKNEENISVLKQVPKATTSATRLSPVGTYDIVIDGGDASNYTFEYDTTAKVIISQSQVEGSRWKDATEENGKFVKSARYNYGMAVSMEVLTTNVDYKVEYFIYNNDQYGADGAAPIAAATEVGEYYVKAVVSHEGSKSQELYGKLIITKADVNVEVYGYESVTYDGNKHAVSGRVKGVNGLDVTIWYLDKSKPNARPTKDAPVNAGTYTVWAEFDGSANKNYNTAKSVERTFVINVATVSVSIEKDQFIFDGTEKRVVYSVANREVLAAQGVYLAIKYYHGDNDSQIVYDSAYTGAESGEAPSEVGTYTYELVLVGGKEGNYTIKNISGNGGKTGQLVIGQSSIVGGSVNKITVTPKSDGNPTIIPVDTDVIYTHYASLEEAEKSVGAANVWKSLSEGSALTVDESLVFLVKLSAISNNNEIDAFSGPVTIKLQLPKGVAGSNVRLARVNTAGEIIAWIDCNYEGDSVTFQAQDLGYYVFVKEAILNTTVVYALIGALGFIMAVGVMVIALKKAAQYRNMKAIVAAKEDIDR